MAMESQQCLTHMCDNFFNLSVIKTIVFYGSFIIRDNCAFMDLSFTETIVFMDRSRENTVVSLLAFFISVVVKMKLYMKFCFVFKFCCLLHTCAFHSFY